MILIRLRFVHNFSVIIMCTPVIICVIIIVLRFFWIRWVLTGESYYFNKYYIVRPIPPLLFAVQNITINVFFIMIAIKHFQNVVHIKSVVIVSIVVTILDGVIVLIGFLIIDGWISFCVMAIVAQIKARLEIEILAYIVEPAREQRTPEPLNEPSLRVEDSPSEGVSENFCQAFNFFLSRSRAAGL
jgi:hypothetical protein